MITRPLTPEMQTAVLDWLRDRHIATCPVCRQASEWRVHSELYFPMAEGVAEREIPILPTIQVVCSRCAHILSFAALPVLGYDPSQPSAPQ